METQAWKKTENINRGNLLIFFGKIWVNAQELASTASLLNRLITLINTVTGFFQFKVQCSRAAMVLKFHLDVAIKRFPNASTSRDLNISLIFLFPTGALALISS